MNKEELFQKYRIEEKHSVWEPIDNFMSIELYLFMNGHLPTGQNDDDALFVIKFLDNVKADIRYTMTAKTNNAEFGNLFLTAKRFVYRHHETILNQLNNQ